MLPVDQGMIHNSRLALSEVGEQQDVDTLTNGYEEVWWLEQLARRNASAIWLRSKYPHNYVSAAAAVVASSFGLKALHRRSPLSRLTWTCIKSPASKSTSTR